MELKKRVLPLVFAVILSVALCAALTSCTISTAYLSNYEDAKLYEVADEGSIDAAFLSGLEIGWFNGTVNVLSTDAEAISFKEVSEGGTKDKDTTLHWLYKDDVLHLQYAKANLNKNLNGLKKHLYVYIPNSVHIDDVEVDSINADINIASISAGDIECDSVVGNMRVSCNADKVEFGSTSGNMFYKGVARNIEMDSVSGRCDVVCPELPSKIEIETTSGAITLYLPERQGFSVEYSTTSGKVSGLLINAYDHVQQQGKKYIYRGGGNCEINIDTVSSNLAIEKYEQLN